VLYLHLYLRVITLYVRWEKRLRRLGILEMILEDVGRVLDDRLGYWFSVLDWTEFTTWSMDIVRVTLTVRISYGTVYPVRAYVFTSSTVIDED